MLMWEHWLDSRTISIVKKDCNRTCRTSVSPRTYPWTLTTHSRWPSADREASKTLSVTSTSMAPRMNSQAWAKKNRSKIQIFWTSLIPLKTRQRSYLLLCSQIDSPEPPMTSILALRILVQTSINRLVTKRLMLVPEWKMLITPIKRFSIR